ncbi:carbohydrate ABC transporter permease [Agrobacterium sp. DSM 25558]|uniref:carbohydrate ABC transporter permease n=1 Tax=Agrobacterium sp. DSM 25558 TaxID=1907665 RepID=UPI001FCD6A2C|nr:sugar ABC transporter permease [Agrobacterium sp. DSM 25558]
MSGAKLVLLPVSIIVLICFYGAILWTTYISLTTSTLVPVYRLQGFAEYVTLLQSSRWRTSFANMFVFGGIFITASLVLGTFLAVLLDCRSRGEAVFRLIYLYPMSMSFVVTGMAWQWLLNPTTGIQQFVRSLGWETFTFDWIVQRDYAIYTVSIAAVWQMAGLVMIIMLAGLRSVDQGIWRAMRMEGASLPRAYLSVVLPMQKPLLVTCVVLLATAVVKSYDLVVAMTGGGPGNSTDVPAKYVVDLLFVRGNIARGAAGAVIMLLSVICALIPYFLVTRIRKGAAQ